MTTPEDLKMLAEAMGFSQVEVFPAYEAPACPYGRYERKFYESYVKVWIERETYIIDTTFKPHIDKAQALEVLDRIVTGKHFHL